METCERLVQVLQFQRVWWQVLCLFERRVLCWYITHLVIDCVGDGFWLMGCEALAIITAE